MRLEFLPMWKLSTLPQGVSPPPQKNFLTLSTSSPTGGVKSYYTYPDRVYAIFSYRSLLQ